MNTTTNTRVSEAMVTHQAAAKALDSLDDYARMGTGVDAHGPRGMLERYIAQQAALSAPEPAAQGDAMDLRVEVRQCDDCDHVGINDCSDTTSACHDCEWQGPTPDEDKCPGCGHENCMAVACPECGGRYRFLADRRFAQPAGQEPIARIDFTSRPVRLVWFRLLPGKARQIDVYEHAAQPAERVPEARTERDYEQDEDGHIDTYCQGHMDGWNHLRELWLAASPRAVRGREGGGGMSDLSIKPKPHYGPVYAAALYPELATIARAHGYALAVHGSLARDLDVIGVPWVEQPSTPEVVIDAITSRFAVKLGGPPTSDKPHGRRVWTLSVGFGECFIDLSFMPTTGAAR